MRMWATLSLNPGQTWGVRRGTERGCVSVGPGRDQGRCWSRHWAGMAHGPPHDLAGGLLLTPQIRGCGRKIYYPSAILLSVCSPL